ncbi:aspartate kinase [Alginatibacterium sediminis]|uniref:Bifunctional aspartokinase/homoserine dehydrogenase n=1 Tax=Alginatibacterium sediminis TaxID=2164068 RepID=A0A420E6I8_9ALTE|nr:bifunctional aspartate kinase/homoserine dehydrogenase II [Alginatibacterium sediminis]RKF13115.1 aspartate kinase [Alginatibacterium sediminis]
MHLNRHVHKFGGSSLADPSCFRRVASIVQQHTFENDLIVVSAAGKTTNRLLSVIELAEQGDQAAVDALVSLFEYQGGLIDELLDSESASELKVELEADRHELGSLLEGALDEFNRNQILSFGERWSARLLAALLRQLSVPSLWQDSREFFRAEFSAQPQVNAHSSAPLLSGILKSKGQQRLVVTGYIARDSQGRTVTLGRNGSDYSATELAALADAASTTIWSDVAGIYSADPRQVKDAVLLEKLSLSEASELTRIGTPVLHSRALEPLHRSRQRLTLRCSYAPDDGQTVVHRQHFKSQGAKIVTAVDDVALIELKLVGDAATDSEQLLSYLASHQLAPATKHLNLDNGRLQLAYRLDLAAEALELLQHQQQLSVSDIRYREGYSLLALVGNCVTENPQHCYRFYREVAEQSLEFVYSSPDKLSLTAVIAKASLEPLLKSLHSTMFKQALRLGVIAFGRGNVGATWLRLFEKQVTQIKKDHHVSLTLAGVFNSKGGLLDYSGLDVEHCLQEPFEGQSFLWTELLEKLELHPFDELVAVDLTASESLSRYYPEFARRGLHVISANKYAGASEPDFYHPLVEQFKEHGSFWLYNATVGAGLPIQHSIRTLRRSGDKVESLSGVFSGTLCWLFENFDGQKPFSQLLRDAWQQGLTEPDPREDLSGQDVARKLLILARESEFDIDLDNIPVENLVPEDLRNVSFEDFMRRLDELDEPMAERLHAAQAQVKAIRYTGHIDIKGEGQVGLSQLDPKHAFVGLNPCDNVVAIHSNWYQSNPLLIRGPGAGKEVTAGAIQADLVSLMVKLGHA